MSSLCVRPSEGGGGAAEGAVHPWRDVEGGGTERRSSVFAGGAQAACLSRGPGLAGCSRDLRTEAPLGLTWSLGTLPDPIWRVVGLKSLSMRTSPRTRSLSELLNWTCTNWTTLRQRSFLNVQTYWSQGQHDEFLICLTKLPYSCFWLSLMPSCCSMFITSWLSSNSLK